MGECHLAAHRSSAARDRRRGPGWRARSHARHSGAWSSRAPCRVIGPGAAAAPAQCSGCCCATPVSSAQTAGASSGGGSDAASQLGHPVVLPKSVRHRGRGTARLSRSLGRISVIAPGTRSAKVASASAAACTKMTVVSGKRSRSAWTSRLASARQRRRRAPRGPRRLSDPELPPNDVRCGEIDFADEELPRRDGRDRLDNLEARDVRSSCIARVASVFERSGPAGTRGRRRARTGAALSVRSSSALRAQDHDLLCRGTPALRGPSPRWRVSPRVAARSRPRRGCRASVLLP